MATMVQGIRMALHYGEEHLNVKDIFGEDVGPPLGGVFTASQGLKTAWNTPLDERGHYRYSYWYRHDRTKMCRRNSIYRLYF